jgi:hypothetical protein
MRFDPGHRGSVTTAGVVVALIVCAVSWTAIAILVAELIE